MAKIENDKYKVTVAGIGYIGDINFKLKGNKVYNTRKSLLHRCYNKNYSQYKYYGEKGVVVDKNFHSFENFYNHVSKLENYSKWLTSKEYNLDKDSIIDNDIKTYSPNTIKIIHYNVIYDKIIEKYIYKEDIINV